MCIVSNNMIYAKKPKVRQDSLYESNKEIGFVKYGLTSKLSSTKLLKAHPYIAKSSKWLSGVEN